MKIVDIDGKKFGVRLPFGGADRDDHDNDWDNALDAGCPVNWRNTLSWCIESIHDNQRVARGYISARHWNYYTASARYPGLGFRPVLVPLDPDTLEPDLTLYAGRDGELVKFGTLTKNDRGDIGFADTSYNPIEWAVFDGKLIAVKVLVTNVSWDELDKMGFCSEHAETGSDRTYTVTEVCPHCGSEIEMRWDTDSRGFKAFCPVCGERLMLCDECRHSGLSSKIIGLCDYDSVTDTCRFNRDDSDRKSQTVYVLFSCDEWKSNDSMRFIAVYDSLEKLKDRVAARIRGEYFEFDSGIDDAVRQEKAFLKEWDDAHSEEEKMYLFCRVKYCSIIETTINDTDD